MIDTHCHIDFEDFDDDREEVIKRARDKLDLIIASGSCPNKINTPKTIPSKGRNKIRA